eukprot:scaffold125486_cov66-Phaeocystis_antarctica.AAC.1
MGVRPDTAVCCDGTADGDGAFLCAAAPCMPRGLRAAAGTPPGPPSLGGEAAPTPSSLSARSAAFGTGLATNSKPSSAATAAFSAPRAPRAAAADAAAAAAAVSAGGGGPEQRSEVGLRERGARRALPRAIRHDGTHVQLRPGPLRGGCGARDRRELPELRLALLVRLAPAHRLGAHRDGVVCDDELLERAAALHQAAHEQGRAHAGELVALEVHRLDGQVAAADGARQSLDAVVAHLVLAQLDGVQRRVEQQHLAEDDELGVGEEVDAQLRHATDLRHLGPDLRHLDAVVLLRLGHAVLARLLLLDLRRHDKLAQAAARVAHRRADGRVAVRPDAVAVQHELPQRQQRAVAVGHE